MNTLITNLEKFCRESNAIEGELDPVLSSDNGISVGRLNPDDLEAAQFALAALSNPGKSVVDAIIETHAILGRYLKEDWVGHLRLCNVRVGDYVAPKWEDVPKLMDKFAEEFPLLDAWEAYNKYETVHGFRDLNGRTGRLIWLHKSLKEGYDFRLTFLEKYHYQTLDHYHSST